MTRSASERQQARRIVGFVGLMLWAPGVIVSAAVTLRSAGDMTTPAGAALVSAIMLGAIALSIETDESPDRVAHAWWVLTLYAVFPAATTSWSLAEAGLLHGRPAMLTMAVCLPVLLSLRAALLASPAGTRFLCVEIGFMPPPVSARRLAPGFASLYLITAAAILVAALADWPTAAFGALVLGLVSVRLAVYVARRTLVDARESSAATPTSAPRP